MPEGPWAAVTCHGLLRAGLMHRLANYMFSKAACSAAMFCGKGRSRTWLPGLYSAHETQPIDRCAIAQPIAAIDSTHTHTHTPKKDTTRSCWVIF